MLQVIGVVSSCSLRLLILAKRIVWCGLKIVSAGKKHGILLDCIPGAIRRRDRRSITERAISTHAHGRKRVNPSQKDPHIVAEHVSCSQSRSSSLEATRCKLCIVNVISSWMDVLMLVQSTYPRSSRGDPADDFRRRLLYTGLTLFV